MGLPTIVFLNAFGVTFVLDHMKEVEQVDHTMMVMDLSDGAEN